MWDNKIDTALHCNLILKYLHYKILTISKYNQVNYFVVKKIRNNEISTSMYKYTFYVNIHGIICMNNKHILSTLSNFKVWIKTASCHKKKEIENRMSVCLSVLLSSSDRLDWFCQSFSVSSVKVLAKKFQILFLRKSEKANFAPFFHFLGIK